MAEITKIQFCEKIVEQKITSASCSFLDSEFCEQIELVLENGTILKIIAGQEIGEPGLWFDES